MSSPSMRLGCLIVLLAASRAAQAQSTREWTFSAGPAVAATEPRAAFDASLGGIISVTSLRRGDRPIAVGFDARVAVLPVRMGGERICLSFSSCFDSSHPRVAFTAGAGVAAQYDARRTAGTRPFIRGHASPTVVASTNRGTDTRISLSFSPSIGAAVGLARNRSRVAVGADLLPNVQGKTPITWSLTFGLAK